MNNFTTQQARRNLLKMLARGATSAPLFHAGLLGSGLGLANAANANAAVKNVIFVFIPGGTPGRARAYFTPDSQLNLKPCTAPLESVKQECVFFSGADMNYSGHGLAQTALGAFSAPKTLDLALADVIGGQSLLSSMRLGVLSTDTSISAVNQWNIRRDVITDPVRAFDLMRSQQAAHAPLDIQAQQKQLEINLKAIQALQSQLGSFASTRLQSNLDAISQLQSEITPPGFFPGCDLQQIPDTAGAVSTTNPSNLNILWERQADNAVTAIKCGITRVVTLLMGGDDENIIPTGFNYNLAQAANSFPSSEFVRFRAALTGLFAQLIQKLQTTTDINGVPLLDSTLVVQVTNMADTSDNTGYDAPFMFAGGGSRIRRGQVAAVRNHGQVLDTVAQAMGVYGMIPAYSQEGPAPGVVV